MGQWIKKGLKKDKKINKDKNKDQVGHGFDLWSCYTMHSTLISNDPTNMLVFHANNFIRAKKGRRRYMCFICLRAFSSFLFMYIWCWGDISASRKNPCCWNPESASSNPTGLPSSEFHTGATYATHSGERWMTISFICPSFNLLGLKLARFKVIEFICPANLVVHLSRKVGPMGFTRLPMNGWKPIILQTLNYTCLCNFWPRHAQCFIPAYIE